MGKIRIFTVAVCAAAVMTGCAKTPEQAIVREKSGQSMDSYKEVETAGPVSIAPSGPETTEPDVAGSPEAETADGQDQAASVGLEKSRTDSQNALAARLQAPETYQAQVQSEDGMFTLNCNAAVQIPAVDKVAVYKVSQKEFSQEWIDKVTEAFFGDAPIYNGITYNSPTKAEVLEELNQLKAWQAEGNTDPYGYIADAREEGAENPEEYYDLQRDIDAREQEYADAPETVERTIVKPGFGEDAQHEGLFIGMAEMDGGVYQYKLKSYTSMPMIIEITNYSKQERKTDIIDWDVPDFDAEEEAAALEKRQSYYSSAGLSEEKAKEMAAITPQEAQKMADVYMEKLGLLGEFSAKNVELSISSVLGDLRGNESHYLDAGYQVNYTRDINGFPVTDEMAYGGGLESMESTLESWSYERVEIILNGDGLQKVVIFNLYEIGEQQVENVQMLPFTEIASVFENMLQIKNSDMTYSNGKKYDIDRVTLGYMRVYDPGADSTTGLLVPVWDFFGRSEDHATYDGEEYISVISRPMQSFMTVNAADGTVIDRDLGY